MRYYSSPSTIAERWQGCGVAAIIPAADESCKVVPPFKVVARPVMKFQNVTTGPTSLKMMPTIDAAVFAVSPATMLLVLGPVMKLYESVWGM